MDLHYSQTYPFSKHFIALFHYLMDLHYSQTINPPKTKNDAFHYLMDLHYSQTGAMVVMLAAGFTTLWIYTILKQHCDLMNYDGGFTTLWIYTILKP